MAWRLAGILGLDPGPLTLRELLAMAEARGREAWAHTSALMALVANCHRDSSKNSVYRPADFDPYARLEADQPTEGKADIAALKAFLR